MNCAPPLALSDAWLLLSISDATMVLLVAVLLLGVGVLIGKAHQ